MSSNKNDSYEDIDEAEEEALLKSDDEGDSGKANVDSNLLQPPANSDAIIDDNSLLNMNDLVEEDSDEENQLLDDIILDADNANDADDDDSDNDDDDGDLKILKEIETLLEELDANHYIYDKYVRLCELSHASGDLDNIRIAYERFSSVYPLTAELWQKYIDVELVVAQTPQEIAKVEVLYQKALKDYYSCDVALKFAEFAKCSPDCLEIWEEILGTYGLHCIRGREFFKLYRQKYAKDLNSPDHLKIYINSFLQELRFPLHEMEDSYIEFKVYYERNKDNLTEYSLDWSDIDKCYFKAKEHLEKIIVYEEKLKELDVQAYRERAEVYFEYIKDTDRFLDENVLQTIYERMVADCCLNAECWIKYIDFINYRDAYGRPQVLQNLTLFLQTADDICKRALRNCSWSAELYIKRMLVLEKMKKPLPVVQEVLESALSAGFETPEPLVSIWLEYLTYLRRHTDWTSPEECERLRKNLDLGWISLGRQWGALADCNCELLKFWGRLEYGPLKDPRRGQDLWALVMDSSDNATKSGLWIEYALLEMQRDLEGTRLVFNKALNTIGLDNPDVIVSAWERFERCNGKITDLQDCFKRCNYFKQRTLDTSFDKTAKTSAASSKKHKKRKLTAEEEKCASPFKQQKLQKPQTQNRAKNSPAKETNYKEHENQEIDLTKDHLSIFLSNLSYSLTEQDVIENLPELKIIKFELISSANGNSRGYGYAELETEAEVVKALTMDRKIISGRPLYISSVLRDKEQRQKFKYNVDKELHKLFIKSLPPDCNKAELEEIFGAYGKLKDVRLVYHKSGKFKQIAYVEYEQESSAGKAVLAIDNMNLRGHNISVAISAPPPKPSTSAAANPAKLLGSAPKRNPSELKPRLSLIPNIVRKNINSQSATGVKPKAAQTASNTTDLPKSNEDFRKLLRK